MRADVIKAVGASMGMETDTFETILRLKAKTEKLSDHDLRALFERYYATLEAMEKTIDGLPV